MTWTPVQRLGAISHPAHPSDQVRNTFRNVKRRIAAAPHTTLVSASVAFHRMRASVPTPISEATRLRSEGLDVIL